MKRFSKLILSVAAVSAVSAAMVISASAMEASYADGVVTLTGVEATGTSQTLLVLDTVDLTTVAAENIKQIDQKDDGTSFGAVTVGALADGTYEVRVGGNGTVQKTTFTVGSAPVVDTITLTIGNVDDNTKINVNDALKVARYAASSTADKGHTGDVYDLADGSGTYLVGNVDDNTKINVNDALKIARYAASSTADKGRTGETVEVIAK